MKANLIGYPLIDMDDTGMHKQPMFRSGATQLIHGAHDLFLVDEGRNRYRLHAKKAHRMIDYFRYAIHCPRCGAVMNSVAPHIDQHKLAVYACPRCNG